MDFCAGCRTTFAGNVAGSGTGRRSRRGGWLRVDHARTDDDVLDRILSLNEIADDFSHSLQGLRSAFPGVGETITETCAEIWRKGRFPPTPADFRTIKDEPSSTEDRGRDAHCWTPTGSPEAVARPRFPQNVACRFPALRSSEDGSQHGESL